MTAGPALERKGDVAAYLTALEPRSIFFVDEIHRLPRALEETFYPAMEDGRLPITVGQGAGARVVTLELPPFTLIGATTRAGLLTTPLRDRFGIQHRLDPYDGAELTRDRHAQRRDPRASRSNRPARRRSPPRSRGTPRVANRLLKRVRDFAEVRAGGVVTARRRRPRRSSCSRSTTLGLDRLDRAILDAVCAKFGGGPVGLSTLAVTVGEEADTIEDVYEPYLLQQGHAQAHARAGAWRPRSPSSTSASKSRADPTRCSSGRPSHGPRVRTSHGRCGHVRGHDLSCDRPWRTTSSAPTAVSAPPRPTATAGFRREARGCTNCGFGFLFELLDDYYPAPDAAFFVCRPAGQPDRRGRGAKELTGLDTERVIGRPVTDVLRLRFDDGAGPRRDGAGVGRACAGQAGRGPRRGRSARACDGRSVSGLR